MRGRAGAEETLAPYLQLEASLYRLNTGTERMGLSCMLASKGWCLFLAPLHLNWKKFRITHLMYKVVYINAARKSV